MISRTLGAPLGGTTVGGHQGLDSLAFSWITPSNFRGGGGSCLPSIVVVALGEPGVPVICWANNEDVTVAASRAPSDHVIQLFLMTASKTRQQFFSYVFETSERPAKPVALLLDGDTESFPHALENHIDGLNDFQLRMCL